MTNDNDPAALAAERARARSIANGHAPSSLLTAANEYVDAQGGGEGDYPTAVNGLHVVRSFHDVEANHAVYRPTICVVVQGAKQILVGEETLRYRAMEYLIVSLDVPACGRILQASSDAPFLGITIEIDVTLMREVMSQLDTPPTPSADAVRSLFVAQVEEPLAACIARLLRMAKTPRAIPILSPAALREIYYWLLTGPQGGWVCRIALPDSHMDRIARAIRHLRNHYAQTLRMEHLAEVAGMSPSSFHQHFKALTAMTPLQFQKQLRLLEARRLLLADAANVTDAAYQVGYGSASQFSREYSRAFGAAPKRDAMDLKAELV